MEASAEGRYTLSKRMVVDGWCIHQVRDLMRTFDMETMKYFASLGRSSKRKESHEVCLEASNCVAYNIDNNTYRTHHAATCNRSNCEPVAALEKDLADTIRSGNVPLISMHEDEEASSGLVIKVHKRRRSSQYMAISHVWYDGLGNPEGNSLPSCQLRQLYDLQPLVSFGILL